MNSFVLDGAVFRKRSGRLSLTTRNTEPPRKKIRRRDDGGAAPLPRDLEKSNPRMYGESSASQSAIGATEKESRYSNIEFKRAQAFLYLNYKKISPQNINKLLKEHLKQFDENETQLKKIFEQCYDLTGCVEKSKAMMKQLETVPCLRLGLGTNLSSEVSNRILSISPCKVSRKNVKIVKQTKDKKSMPIRLKKKIEKKIIQCFGKDHYKNDRKILFSKIINDYTKTHNTDYNSDTTTISDTEIDETDNFCRLTKCFRVSVTEIDSLEGNAVTEPNTDSIALGHSSSLSNPQLNTDVNVQNAECFALWTNIDLEKIMFPRLVIDECSHNSSDTNIDVEEITVSRLIIDECSQNASDTNIDTEDFAVSRLIIDEGVQNAKDSPLKTKTDVEAITFPQLIIDECSHANSIINNGEIINLALEKYTSTQDLASSHINALKIDTDIADSKKPSEILDHTNIELKIRKILNPDDNVFNNSIIKDLATYFLNNDFLSKVDVLWKTTESKLVEELIIKLLNMFNSTKYNMALFTGCVICIFREIAQKSSFPPRQMKFKLILLLDAIKKYIKFHDNELWRNWFLPIMFFDWCFIVACIFMNSKNQFKIDLNKSVIRNATAYYKMVKRCKYLFIDQNSKTIKNIGVFELSRIDDLLEFDGVHATNDTTEIPDIPSNELERKKLETDDNYMDTIDLTLPENIEEVCPAPVYPKISVRPEFMYSNSFIKKSNWFTGPVSEILKKWSISMTNGSFKSSTVQNNSTVIVNNEEPSSVNKRRSATNKPTKNKKSKTGFESPRVFFTIANNPTEFDITYGSPSIPQMSSSSEVAQMSSSSVVPQMSSSSVVSQANLQITSSLGVPKTSSLSAISQMSSLSAISQMSSLSAISQMSSLSAISQMSSSSAISQMSSSSVALQNVSSSAVSQNLSPYYNNFSSNNTDSQLPVTPIPRNLSIYYNNIVPDTQVPSGLQSIVNTTQLSNARVTNPPVEKNITSTLHSHYSNIQPSIHHQHSTAMNSQLPKAANTWPLNLYSNLCSDPSYSKSSTSHTDYINSAPSYPQSQYNHYIPPATLYPRHSNALTYPLNYIPTSSDLLTNTTAMVSSVNSYMEHQNYIYGNSCLSQNNFHNTDHNTQVSPDLPDARLPNMPNHQDSNTLKKTCMAANCTNTSNLSCNNCMVAFYCCAKCQKSDWHYHQNECRHSF
ncbi:uncharacterized protein LOC111033932 [Myzus persicae]|uniref:uncharacterized protein LOC111033932 n=1 Tax=Myzus persicae TaxID=13164 RepID=UPI000B92F97A|nr:uncharacterized protein LOC111033932 [Myzus persicae]